jgi:hypothetical protein
MRGSCDELNSVLLNKHPMAISKNFLLRGVRGTINKQIVIREVGGKVILSAYPDMDDRKLSPKQLRRNEIMRQANEELRAIKADKQQRDAAQLRLNVPSNKLHHALLKELLLKYGKGE